MLRNPRPTPKRVPNWRLDFRKAVAAGSTNPGHAFQWITEVESPGMNWNRLRESYPFYTLDIKLPQAVSRVLPACPDLHREVNLETNESQVQGCMLTGRHLTFMVRRHFRLSESDATLAELTELFEVKVKCGVVKMCLYDWGMCLNRLSYLVEPSHLEHRLKTVEHSP